MLPSRGLVQSSQALRLRQVTSTSRAGCARNFGTAMRSRSGAPVTAFSLSIGQMSGRRVGATPHSSNTNSRSNNLLRTPPSSTAAFSLWPFSSSSGGSFKSSDVIPEKAAATSPSKTGPSEFVPEAPVPTSAAEVAAAPSSYSPPVTLPSVTSSPVDSLPDLPDLNDPNAIAELLDGSALLDMPSDQIGYLNALGLDFGWGPTSMCQWLLEHVHVYTGLPWWASIIGAAVLFRAMIILPSLTAAEHSAKLQVLRKNPKYAAAMAEMQAMALKGGTQGQAKAMEARLTMKRMQEAMNVSTWRMFVPMINIPFGYGMFRLMRAMATLPVPGLETGGILWFTDLTVPDPYFVLPLASAGIMYLIFRSNMKYMAKEQQTTMKYVQLAITPISILVTVKMSAGLTFFFLTSSVLQMIQTWLWHQPWLREWKGLPPMHEMLQGGAINNTGPGGSGGAGGVAAARPVSFRLDPGSSWKAPRTTSTGVPEATSDAASSSAKSADEILPAPPTAVEVAKKGWSKMMGTAKEKQNASNDKEVLRKAQEYEKKRAMEDEAQLYQRRDAERQYRAMKKTMSTKKNDTTPNKWQ